MTFPGEKKLPHLFQPGKVGKYELKNRVKYGACCVSNYNNRDGSITPRELARTRIIAQTGAGMITNQGAYPDPKGEGKSYYRQTAIYDDRFLPEFEQIAGFIHDAGAVAIQQLLHCGRYGGVDLGYAVGPSEVPQTLPHFRPVRAMTKEEIKRTVDEYAEAAKRAVKVGYDGVEITSFMGYLLANFNSSFTNKRTDEYGGSVENRGRFMRELIYSIKEAIDDRLLIVRLNGNELMDRYGGSSEDECVEFMKMAADCGVDMISVTVGWQESPESSIARDIAPGHWNYLAARAKKVCGDVPIAYGVRLPHANLANEGIGKGEFDYWEVCRPFLADPERLHKVREDRTEEIKPCVGCLLCLSRLFRDLPYLCTVNPALGHEYEPEYSITKAAGKKKIHVIGAGPAGLEFAITAAQRGHRVTVYDQEEEIGGQLRMAAKKDLATKEDLKDLLTYYQAYLKKYDIELKLGEPVTKKMVSQLAKKDDIDVAVVAAGSRIDLTRLPGAEKLPTAFDIVDDKIQPGKKVIVVGGGKVGISTAEYLASKDHQVILVETAKRIAGDVMPTWKWRHTSWVKELGIKTYTEVNIKELTATKALLTDKNGEAIELTADNIIVSTPRHSNQELLHELEFLVDELYVIGDAVSPRGLYNAIHDGYKLGTRI